MTVKINVDGIIMKFEDSDNDSDEKICSPPRNTGSVTTIQQPTELEGSLKELNADDINEETRMSAIDMRTRLHAIEISAVLAVDSLVALGVLPQKCLPLSTQKKRLNVSEEGKGRKEMVELVAGKREIDSKMGAMGRMGEGIKNFMGGGR